MNNRKTVILINGKARSGKTTLANLLHKYINPFNVGVVSIMHNADAVKDVARDIFKWDDVKDDKGRKLLIDITNSGYNYDPYFWEKKTLDKILETNSQVTIIPDWRYMNTWELFYNSNFNVITLYMEREHLNNGLCDDLKNDISELGFNNFDFDYKVYNKTDNLEALERMVATIFVPQLIQRIDDNE